MIDKTNRTCEKTTKISITIELKLSPIRDDCIDTSPHETKRHQPPPTKRAKNRRQINF